MPVFSLKERASERETEREGGKTAAFCSQNKVDENELEPKPKQLNAVSWVASKSLVCDCVRSDEMIV